MKANVDLTENRDFRKRKDIQIYKFFSTFPWDFNNSERYTDKKELVFTGNKEKRALKKNMQKYENNEECERCGTNLSKKPWKMEVGLCTCCDQLLEDQFTNKKKLIPERL